MATSSEDVLLQMSEVRYKKGDGTLYVMSERLAWMADNSDTVAVSIRYTEIKSLKLSPEGKPKIQLQVALHDGNTSTFHFVNSGGHEATLADRKKVKELLQCLLPNFRHKVDKAFEKKRELLTDHPALLNLYKNLVLSKIIESSEFWSIYAKDYLHKNRKEIKQEPGVSGGFLCDIKPRMDGINGLRYNLTKETIKFIFRTYPSVKQKHYENVPHKISENTFWTKFFQSHYFHRDRILGGTRDIFAECGRIDDQTLRKEIQKVPEDTQLDMENFRDIYLEEGYLENSPENTEVKSFNTVHQTMIQRFNQHSVMVLKTSLVVDKNFRISRQRSQSCKTRKLEEEQDKRGANASKSEVLEMKDDTDGEITSSEQRKTSQLLEKIDHQDLGHPYIEGMSKEEADVPLPPLKETISIEGFNRYLFTPMMSSVSEGTEGLRSMDEMYYAMINVTQKWDKRVKLRQHLSSTAAVNALGVLSPGGALMRGYLHEACAPQIPREIQDELHDLYVTLLEILMHYYKVFPISSRTDRVLVMRHSEALQRFKQFKLIPFEERVIIKLSSMGSTLCHHLHSLMKAAKRRELTWNEVKSNKLWRRAILAEK